MIIIQVINEEIARLEENADADVDEMKAQKNEMEDIVQPIIAGLYQVVMVISTVREAIPKEKSQNCGPFPSVAFGVVFPNIS